MTKKVLAIVMCILILCSSVLVIGCNKDEIEETDTTVSTVATNEGDWEYTPPNVNLEGRDFKVLTWKENNEWVLELSADQSTIDSSVYYHLASVEQELNLNFVSVYEAGEFENMTNFISKVSVLSGDDAVDLICQYSLATAIGVQQGLYLNLRELDHIRLDAPYWSKDLVEKNTINNKLFWITGDITASVPLNMYLFVFNYNKASEYRLGDLYELVREGKWTLEKLMELSSNVYVDVNNNQAADKGDFFGFVTGAYTFNDAFAYGCNLYTINRTSKGKLEIDPDFCGERGIDVTNKIKKLFHDNGVGSYVTTKVTPDWWTCMEDGGALFSIYPAYGLVNQLVSSEVNYGILPMPKYDEEQTDYHTCLSMTHSMFSIPISTPDPNASAAVLESMAHSGHVNLSPKVFEALQYRYSQRVEDTEMLTIVRDGIIYDTGRMVDTIGIYAIVRSVVRDNLSLTSHFAKYKESIEEKIMDVNFMFS